MGPPVRREVKEVEEVKEVKDRNTSVTASSRFFEKPWCMIPEFAAYMNGRVVRQNGRSTD
jgi:hypothetical protein